MGPDQQKGNYGREWLPKERLHTCGFTKSKETTKSTRYAHVDNVVILPQ